MKNKMITAVLAMSMVLGAGSASYAAEKTVSCTNPAGPGQTVTAAKFCDVQTVQDFEMLCKGQSSMTSQVVSLVNSERAAQGIAALQNDSKLSEIAQQKAEDMAKNQYFSHTSPTYGSAFDMLKAAGYSYKTAGENIAMGQKSAASVMDGWMHSSGHRANILHTSYEKIGVGYAVSADGTPYWVQIFAG